jgi:hypothetical protein
MKLSAVYPKFDRDIVFVDRLKKGDLADHERCYLWEVTRTRYHMLDDFRKEVEDHRKAEAAHQAKLAKAKTQKKRDALNSERLRDRSNLDVFFPFYVTTWPAKPYLSHPQAQRLEWGPLKDKPQCSLFDELLIPFERFKVPVTVYLDPDWTKGTLQELVKKQAGSVLEEAKAQRDCLERKGPKFSRTKASKPLKTWKSRLKQLGVYRLIHCLKMPWWQIEDSRDEHFGKRLYEDERSFENQASELLKRIPPPKGG